MKNRSIISKMIIYILTIIGVMSISPMKQVQASDKTIFMNIDFEPVFDAQYYAQQNPELVEVVGSDETVLFQHFINNGMKEGRKSSEYFDVNSYIKYNPDLVAVLGTEDLSAYYMHYAAYGYAEGRIASLDGKAQQVSEKNLEKIAYDKLIAMKAIYPEGLPYTNADSYVWMPYLEQYNVHYTGYGCAGFSFLMSDAAFGNARITKHYDASRIKVGDILRVNNNTHSVVVLEVKPEGVVVTEGNYNKTIHWGRFIDWGYLQLDYVFTRYE